MLKDVRKAAPSSVFLLICAVSLLVAQPAPGGNSAKRAVSKKAGSKKAETTKGSANQPTAGGTTAGKTQGAKATPTPAPDDAAETEAAAEAPDATATDNSKSAQEPSDGTSPRSSPNVCREARVGPQSDAKTLQSQLDKAGGVSVSVAGNQDLIMCGAAASVDVLEAAVLNLSAAGARAHGHESHLLRLFYFRDGKSIADAINNAGGLGTPVKALGDLLIFTSESQADDRAIHELKSWIAMIDVPRPQVSISAWSIQISSTNLESLQTESGNTKALVSVYNKQLQDALLQGWRYLDSQTRVDGARQAGVDEKRSTKLDTRFVQYLTHRYVRTPSELPDCPGEREQQPPPCKDQQTSFGRQQCGPNEYCLGYTRMFSPLQPSLTNMLIALVATEPGDGATRAITSFVDCLESKEECRSDFRPQDKKARYETTKNRRGPTIEALERSKAYSTTPLGDCERDDFESYKNQNITNVTMYPSFECFRRELEATVVYPPSHALLQMALADFLFHYKTAELYPEDFIPWNRGASAQRLDNLLSPLFVQFNRDLGVYLRVLSEGVTRQRAKDKKIDYSSEGLVTIAVLSGAPATVTTTTQSFITVPPVLSAAQFLKAAKDAGTSDFSALLSSNLTAEAAQSLIALTQSVQSKTAQVGRDLSLNITANSLSGASSAELDVQLDSTEHVAPTYLDESNNSSNDNVSRVAAHSTKTKVRVDSLKLFEVSTFSATLTHGRSVPLLPPFIDLPYLGNLARLRLPPGTVFHRSFAIVSAVIVPTAADIANAIEFRSDLQASTLPKAEWLPTLNKSDAQTGGAKGAKGAGRTTATIQVDPKPEPAGYYWVVTHYPEGISVSAPAQKDFDLSKDTQSPSGQEKELKNARAGHPLLPMPLAPPKVVSLAWEAPPNALSFDIYCAPIKSGETAEGERQRWFKVTSHSIHGRTFRDDGARSWNAKSPELVEIPVDTIIYVAIPTLPGNLNEFHNAKLDCLKDADPASCPPKLSAMPVTRFHLAH